MIEDQASARTRDGLKTIAAREALAWSRKPIGSLRRELKGAIGYERDCEGERLQFEVLLLEDETDCMHVCVSVDDGSIRWACNPVSTSFLAHSDGRVDP